MSRIIIIRGTSGSGKTTIAHELAKKNQSTAVLCPDYFYHEVFKEVENKDTIRQYVYDGLKALISYYMAKQVDIILEGILSSIYKRGLFADIEKMAKERSYDIHCFLLEISIGTALERNKDKTYLNEANQREWYQSLQDSIKDGEVVISVEELDVPRVIEEMEKHL